MSTCKKHIHTYSDIHVLNATHTMISVNISSAQNCVVVYFVVMDDSDDSFATSLHLILVSTVKQIQKTRNKSRMTKIGDCLWRKWVDDKGNSCHHNPAIYSLSFLSEFIAYATKINDVNELLAMSAKKRKTSEVTDSL